MSDSSTLLPFEYLGITPTTDREAIRRAYAARLKSIDVTRDPTAFRRLRAAYEAALSGLASVVPEERLDRGSQPERVGPIWQNLRGGEVATAFRLLESADAASELPLAMVLQLEQEFLAQSPAAPLATLSRLVKRFRWEEAAHPLRQRRPSLFRPLDRRLDAERWYGDLLTRAEMRPWSSRYRHRFAARLMLLGPPHWYESLGLKGWHLMLATPRQALMEVLKQYDLHGEWLGDRFNPGRIRWCRQQIRPGRMFATYVLIFGSIVPIAAVVQDGDVPAALAAWTFLMLIALIVWIVLRISHRFRERP